MRRKQYIRGRKLYENSVGEDEGDGVRNSLAGKKSQGLHLFFSMVRSFLVHDRVDAVFARHFPMPSMTRFRASPSFLATSMSESCSN